MRPAPRATPPPGITADTPVILIVFDELSLPTLIDKTHHIDAVRYPAFAALAETSHWFRKATTSAETTMVAVPAILTGRYLGQGRHASRLATAASFPENLFTLLGGSYRFNVFESMTGLCPRELCGATALDLPLTARLSYLASDLGVVYLHRLLPPDLTTGLPAIKDQWGHFALLVHKKRKRSAWAKSDRKARYFAAFRAAAGTDTGV